MNFSPATHCFGPNGRFHGHNLIKKEEGCCAPKSRHLDEMAPRYAPSLRSRLVPLLLILQLGFVVVYALYIEIDASLGGITFNNFYPGECRGSGRCSCWGGGLSSWTVVVLYNIYKNIYFRCYVKLKVCDCVECRALGRSCSYSWWTLISSNEKELTEK